MATVRCDQATPKKSLHPPQYTRVASRNRLINPRHIPYKQIKLIKRILADINLVDLVASEVMDSNGYIGVANLQEWPTGYETNLTFLAIDPLVLTWSAFESLSSTKVDRNGRVIICYAVDEDGVIGRLREVLDSNRTVFVE